MRELLKLLNDLNPSDVGDLTKIELVRLESLCAQWASVAEAEQGRRALLPRSAEKSV
jgi:hypothetical protein